MSTHYERLVALRIDLRGYCMLRFARDWGDPGFAWVTELDRGAGGHRRLATGARDEGYGYLQINTVGAEYWRQECIGGGFCDAILIPGIAGKAQALSLVRRAGLRKLLLYSRERGFELKHLDRPSLDEHVPTPDAKSAERLWRRSGYGGGLFPVQAFTGLKYASPEQKPIIGATLEESGEVGLAYREDFEGWRRAILAFVDSFAAQPG